MKLLNQAAYLGTRCNLETIIIQIRKSEVIQIKEHHQKLKSEIPTQKLYKMTSNVHDKLTVHLVDKVNAMSIF